MSFRGMSHGGDWSWCSYGSTKDLRHSLCRRQKRRGHRMLHSDSAGMRTQRIRVRSAYGDYQVICGAGLLARAAEEIRALGGFTNVFVVSSPRVWRAVGRRVLRGLPLADHKRVILFDDHEAAKQMKTVESLCRSEEHTSELQSRLHLVCRLLLEKKKKKYKS